MPQIVEQFGAFKKIARPGFNCINCFCCEFVAGSLNMRVQQLNVECETKTKDNVFVRILVAVQFMVEKGTDYSEEGPYYKAFYKLDNAPSQMRSYVLNVVRSEVPSMELDHVFTEKEKIAAAIRTELAEQLSSYGYSILSTLITDIDPDIRVKTAMNEINAAQRLRVAAKEKAEADKIRVVKAAEGDAESKYLQGTGIMRQRQAIINGLREDVKVFAGEIKDVAAKDVMDMMIVTQVSTCGRRAGRCGGLTGNPVLRRAEGAGPRVEELHRVPPALARRDRRRRGRHPERLPAGRGRVHGARAGAGHAALTAVGERPGWDGTWRKRNREAGGRGGRARCDA